MSMSKAKRSLNSQRIVLKFLLDLPQIYETGSLPLNVAGSSRIIALEGARLAPYGAIGFPRLYRLRYGSVKKERMIFFGLIVLSTSLASRFCVNCLNGFAARCHAAALARRLAAGTTWAVPLVRAVP
jgi:hypothetical protein